ncbi:hypothetical protein K440DRAFT_640852 [Wilcoxina mikolae CBS 423.85]|nr:hypothetical protein K440DRAFT_640852 [Wilcoxina mikolae CBS 423.85]
MIQQDPNALIGGMLPAIEVDMRKRQQSARLFLSVLAVRTRNNAHEGSDSNTSFFIDHFSDVDSHETTKPEKTNANLYKANAKLGTRHVHTDSLKQALVGTFRFMLWLYTDGLALSDCPGLLIAPTRRRFVAKYATSLICFPLQSELMVTERLLHDITNYPHDIGIHGSSASRSEDAAYPSQNFMY